MENTFSEDDVVEKKQISKVKRELFKEIENLNEFN